MHLISNVKLLFIALLSLGLVACSKDSTDKAPPAMFSADSSLLQYVADDTAYVFAMLEPLPDDVMDKLEPQLDTTLKSYHRLIRGVLREEIESGEENDEESVARMERVAAVVDGMSGLFSLEGMRGAGIGRDATAVMYGAGLLPVLRVKLTDAEDFEAALVRIETEAGAPMAVSKIDDQSYRYTGDDKGRVIIALVGSDLVVSLVPTGIGDDSLREILGLKAPATSIAASGRLRKMAADNGFTGYGAGFVDIERAAGVFLDAPSGINAELLNAVDYSSESLSPVCRDEIRVMAAVAPRLVTGYTDITVDRIASNSILELRKDIADGLATLVAPVPGMGSDHGGVFSFGMSIDLLAAREFYSARLEAMQKDPYECEHFAELQAGLEKGREMLNQPVPPMVYGVKGFLAVVENIEGLDIASKTPPTSIDMRFLLATENAPGLLAMGSMFSPELAALNLQADGKPVRFESPQLQAAPIDTAYVAMNDGALAISVGEGTEVGLAKMMEAKAGDPPPFMSMQMDAGRYYSFIGEAMMASNELSADSPAEVNAAVGDIMQGISELADRLSFNVNFTDRGIEVPTELTLAD